MCHHIRLPGLQPFGHQGTVRSCRLDLGYFFARGCEAAPEWQICALGCGYLTAGLQQQQGLLHFLLPASGYASRSPSTQELMASAENDLPGSEEMNRALLPGAVCYLQSQRQNTNPFSWLEFAWLCLPAPDLATPRSDRLNPPSVPRLIFFSFQRRYLCAVMSPQSSFQYAKQHKPCKPLVSRFFQPSYYFCGCFWHLPQFFNFLLKTWASEQYSVFQRWARQLRRCLISRTVSSVSVSEEGAGGEEGGGIPGSKLRFTKDPLLWDSHSFPSDSKQPLSEHICLHRLSPRSARGPHLGPSRAPVWAARGLSWLYVGSR